MPLSLSTSPPRTRRIPRTALVYWLYLRAILREFRWTLAVLAVAIAFGTVLYHFAPTRSDRDHSWLTSMYGAWVALLAQTLDSPPPTWYLKLLCAVYPVLGFILLGEGVVRLSLLMISRRRGEKEWMQVMASTARDHVILCGLGHLGFRIVEQLHQAGVDVVCIEVNPNSRLIAPAKTMGVAVLIRDMTEDQALIDAGLEHARAIVAATDNDIANLEVALDARRVRSDIRVILRLFDQHLAGKVSGALSVDAAFSSSSLAAPVVAGLALGGNVLSASLIAGVQYLVAEVRPMEASELIGLPLTQVESSFAIRVVATVPVEGPAQSPPASEAIVRRGDTLVVHATLDRLIKLTAVARGTSTSQPRSPDTITASTSYV